MSRRMSDSQDSWAERIRNKRKKIITESSSSSDESDGNSPAQFVANVVAEVEEGRRLHKQQQQEKRTKIQQDALQRKRSKDDDQGSASDESSDAQNEASEFNFSALLNEQVEEKKKRFAKKQKENLDKAYMPPPKKKSSRRASTQSRTGESNFLPPASTRPSTPIPQEVGTSSSRTRRHSTRNDIPGIQPQKNQEDRTSKKAHHPQQNHGEEEDNGHFHPPSPSSPPVTDQISSPSRLPLNSDISDKVSTPISQNHAMRLDVSGLSPVMPTPTSQTKNLVLTAKPDKPSKVRVRPEVVTETLPGTDQQTRNDYPEADATNELFETSRDYGYGNADGDNGASQRRTRRTSTQKQAEGNGQLITTSTKSIIPSEKLSPSRSTQTSREKSQTVPHSPLPPGPEESSDSDQDNQDQLPEERDLLDEPELPSKLHRHASQRLPRMTEGNQQSIGTSRKSTMPSGNSLSSRAARALTREKQKIPAIPIPPVSEHNSASNQDNQDQLPEERDHLDEPEPPQQFMSQGSHALLDEEGEEKRTRIAKNQEEKDKPTMSSSPERISSRRASTQIRTGGNNFLPLASTGPSTPIPQEVGASSSRSVRHSTRNDIPSIPPQKNQNQKDHTSKKAHPTQQNQSASHSQETNVHFHPPSPSSPPITGQISSPSRLPLSSEISNTAPISQNHSMRLDAKRVSSVMPISSPAKQLITAQPDKLSKVRVRPEPEVVTETLPGTDNHARSEYPAADVTNELFETSRDADDDNIPSKRRTRRTSTQKKTEGNGQLIKTSTKSIIPSDKPSPSRSTQTSREKGQAVPHSPLPPGPEESSDSDQDNQDQLSEERDLMDEPELPSKLHRQASQRLPRMTEGNQQSIGTLRKSTMPSGNSLSSRAARALTREKQKIPAIPIPPGSEHNSVSNQYGHDQALGERDNVDEAPHRLLRQVSQRPGENSSTTRMTEGNLQSIETSKKSTMPSGKPLSSRDTIPIPPVAEHNSASDQEDHDQALGERDLLDEPEPPQLSQGSQRSRISISQQSAIASSSRAALAPPQLPKNPSATSSTVPVSQQTVFQTSLKPKRTFKVTKKSRPKTPPTVAERYVGNDVFGNYHMLEEVDVKKMLQKARPDLRLSAEKIRSITIKLNHFLEDFFTYCCNKTRHPHGFVTFLDLYEALKQQLLVPEEDTPIDFMKTMKTLIPPEDFHRGEGIIIPSRFSPIMDTIEYMT